jgi:hypothetical protein
MRSTFGGTERMAERDEAILKIANNRRAAHCQRKTKLFTKPYRSPNHSCKSH